MNAVIRSTFTLMTAGLSGGQGQSEGLSTQLTLVTVTLPSQKCRLAGNLGSVKGAAVIPRWDPQDMAELHVGSPGKRTKMLPRDGRRLISRKNIVMV